MTIYTEEHLCKGGTKWKWLASVLFSVLAFSLSSGLLFAAEDGYHPDIGDYAKIVKGREHRYVYNFGPTGLTGWFYEKEFVINGLDKGSPADGIVKLGDRVRAVNGRRFVSTTFKDDEQDPRRVLGYGITEAEAGDGKLKVTVWRGDKEVDLTINLPVTGSYAPLWPYDCKKSAKILKDACQWLVDRQLPRGSFVRNRDGGFALGPSLEGLLLLSSGDPKFLESARRLAYDFVKHPGPDPLKGEKQGTDGWGQSYQAMFVAEYYLRTGDSYVVPYLTWMREVLDTGMGEAGGWGHAYGHVGGYAVGGYINPLVGDGQAKQRDAFKLDAWNTIVIKAQGKHIQTWVNGMPIADYYDNDKELAASEGFIGLQLHWPVKGKAGKLRWRNLRIKELKN